MEGTYIYIYNIQTPLIPDTCGFQMPKCALFKKRNRILGNNKGA
jgi:hypothetical protein